MLDEADDERRDPPGKYIAVGIVLLVGVVIAVSVVGLFYLGKADTDDADVAVATNDYFRALNDGDENEACELQTDDSPECRESLSGLFEQFDELEFDDIDISDIEIDDDDVTATASVSFLLKVNDEEAKCEDVQLAYFKEDNDWRIADLPGCQASLALLGPTINDDAADSDVEVVTLGDEDQAAISEAVSSYLEGFAADDLDAICALESQGFEDNLPEGQSCDTFYEELLATIGALDYQEISVEGAVGIGDAEHASALVTYTSVLDGEEQLCEALTWLLVKEEGEWLIDQRPNCTQIGEPEPEEEESE